MTRKALLSVSGSPCIVVVLAGLLIYYSQESSRRAKESVVSRL